MFPSMHLVGLYFALATLTSLVSCLPTEQAGHAATRLRDVIVFPNGTWVENIAVRPNGNLLVTLINLPEVWEVDPLSGSAELVYSFPNANVSLGIAEVEHDVFAVNVGNFSGPGIGVPGSWSIWTLDYNTADAAGHPNHDQTPSSSKPAGKKVATLPSAVFLNGLTALPTKPGFVLTGDSFLGQILAVDTFSGRYSVAIDVPELKRNTSTDIKLGVNGIHIRSGYLYFTNSLKSPLFAKIPLHIDGSVAGPVETIVKSPQYPIDLGFQADDFALDTTAEYAWVATNPSNVIVKITIATGKQQVVAGGKSDPEVAGATGAAFGRNWYDKQTLYIVTDGGLVDPSSAGTTGGKIIAFDTTKVIS